MPYVVWHGIDLHTQQPLTNCTVTGISKIPGVGNWAATTNACGDAKTLLAAGNYDVTFSAPGYKADGYFPATIGTEGGEITKGLVRDVGPFTPAPRDWRGNMCGVRVGGLPPVQGGAADASLVLSWFYDRYDVGDRSAIRTAWRNKGLTHVLLSWPDSRAFGQSLDQFRATCQELITAGFFPCVMLSSKDFDAPDVPGLVANLTPVLQSLVGIVPMFCIGWELSLWLSPAQVQQLTDALSPLCLKQPGTLVYVHFQEGYMSFPPPNTDNATYWRQQVGKLTGVLAQKRINDDDGAFLDWIHDCLARFSGGFNMPADSGFGHPFDYVMLEISAMTQFNGTCSEAEGNRQAQLAINAPKVSGPAGAVGVMGSGNGA